jgi:hypothetical protein
MYCLLLPLFRVGGALRPPAPPVVAPLPGCGLVLLWIIIRIPVAVNFFNFLYLMHQFLLATCQVLLRSRYLGSVRGEIIDSFIWSLGHEW